MKRTELKKQLEGDRDRYLALYHQTIGGLLVLEHLEKEDEPDAITQDELESMIGGKIEAIEPIGEQP